MILDFLTKTGGESIGYFLIVEFKDTETTILHKVLSVIRGCAEMEKYKIDLPDETTFLGLSILPDQRRILVEGKEIYLTHHEFDMMIFLARHPGRVFTKEQLYEAVWDDIPVSVYAKVMCMIYSIRQKLKSCTVAIPCTVLFVLGLLILALTARGYFSWTEYHSFVFLGFSIGFLGFVYSAGVMEAYELLVNNEQYSAGFFSKLKRKLKRKIDTM